MKMKTKKALATLLAAAALALLLVGCSANYVHIREVKHKKIEDNLYCSDELNKAELSKYSQIISDYIKENYDCDVYISGYYISENNDYTNNFSVYQIINGVILADTFCTIKIYEQNSSPSDMYFQSHRFNFMDEKNINTEGLLNFKEIKKTATILAKENIDEMLNSDNIINIIDGKAYLEYSLQDGLYYKVDLNHGSYIKLDAKTGDVIHTYFFNGVIFD